MTRDAAATAQLRPISFAEAARVWARIGFLSFGGPAGQIALMHAELVDKRRWISEARFLHALNYCMLLPGPEAQQLAIYIGWLLHRTQGGIVAGMLFVLPGAVAIVALSVLYAGLRHVPAVAALFFGLKAAVLAVVIEAVLRIGRRALKTRLMVIIACLAWAAIFLAGAPFPAIVGTAGLFGLLGSRMIPSAFPAPADIKVGHGQESIIDAMLARGELMHAQPSGTRACKVLLVCLLLWLIPIAAAAALAGKDSVFVKEGVFFSKTAVVTFGGAYAVLAYVAQRAVETYAWLQPGEMLDGLSMAETTPGPLIMVVQFVGFMGAFRHGGGLSPWICGILGSAMTVWVTFVPCFLWIFLGAPYIEALRGNQRLHAALSAITAAVVGVIANLALWFALHTMFDEVVTQRLGLLHLTVPVWHTVQAPSIFLTLVALLATFRLKLGTAPTLLLCAALGIAWKTLLAPAALF